LAYGYDFSVFLGVFPSPALYFSRLLGDFPPLYRYTFEVFLGVFPSAALYFSKFWGYFLACRKSQIWLFFNGLFILFI
jgi:hypothetical protein